jgi:hypothetical protein
MTPYFPADFISGAITAGYLVLGLLFLRFWRRTQDVLFPHFAIAFWLLALNQAVASFSNTPESDSSAIYLIRLAAFLIIIVAIVRKNVGTPRRR